MSYWYSPKIILFLILLFGLFFRSYNLESLYSWGHDQDLFAWIAKDIVIDNHLRLIGQETSITGVFIGPLFYYLLASSMALFHMDPVSANFPTIIISLLTIYSIYWVFTHFFGKKVGLIGAFLYSISPGIILVDRWVVPTQSTHLWVIWYLYVLFSILKGKFPLVITGILIGLIWHVHVAFIPLLVLIPIALWLSKKQENKIRIKFKSIVISFLAIFILSLPLIAFETRHGFQQVNGLIHATYEEKEDIKGIDRVAKVFNIAGRELAGTFLLDKNPSLPKEFFISLPIILFFVNFYLYKRKLLTKNQALIIGGWMSIDLLGQFISKRSIPEYYFANLNIVLVLLLPLLTTSYKKILQLSPVIAIICLIATTFWLVNLKEPGGYLYKREAVEYIKNNAENQKYSCIAINFIEGYKGLPNGFRYLFWKNNLGVITSGNDVPVYSIVTPWTISEKEINNKFGIFGVILPKPKTYNFSICNQADRQLLPLWGFNN